MWSSCIVRSRKFFILIAVVEVDLTSLDNLRGQLIIHLNTFFPKAVSNTVLCRAGGSFLTDTEKLWYPGDTGKEEHVFP